MDYRNGNYCAFYVTEPFSQSNLGAAATKDFVTYNLLCAWKGSDGTYPFIDSNNKNYNVRDSSDWETTLKPRLRERIRKSKNIVLILSSVTQSSRALREEIEYGINTCKLPIIVIYPEYGEKMDIADENGIKKNIKLLWDKLPVFRDNITKVPTLHIPCKKELIRKALNDGNFMVSSMVESGTFYYTI